MRTISSCLLALLTASTVAACSSTTEDSSNGEGSEGALSQHMFALLGSFVRTPASAGAIRGAIIPQPGPTEAQTVTIDVDPAIVAGLCAANVAQCPEARVKGTLSQLTLNGADGSFVLTAADPASVPAALASYYGRYTFHRWANTLTLRNAAQTQDLELLDAGYCMFPTDCGVPDACTEKTCQANTCGYKSVADCATATERVEGILAGIDGSWVAQSTVPTGVYVSMQLTATTNQAGTFTAKRSLDASAPTITGSYDLGPPNVMIGLAPWVFHEDGGTTIDLHIGGARHDAAGNLVSVAVVLGSMPSVGFQFVRP